MLIFHCPLQSSLATKKAQHDKPPKHQMVFMSKRSKLHHAEHINTLTFSGFRSCVGTEKVQHVKSIKTTHWLYVQKRKSTPRGTHPNAVCSLV